MAKTRKEKEKIIEGLVDKLSRAKMVIFTDYRGLKMDELEELRDLAFEKNIEYKVVKINLLKIAASKTNIDLDADYFKDKPLAVCFGYEDEIVPAKVIYNFTQSHENLEILGGLLEGNFVDSETIKNYALLPDREELYAKLLGTVAAPISGMINVLTGNLKGLINVLRAYKEQVTS